jgi:hypothetical protein
MTCRDLRGAAAILLFVVGCSSSNSDDGVGGAGAAAAGRSGAATADAGANSVGGADGGNTASGGSAITAGSSHTTAGSGGSASGGGGGSGGSGDLPAVDPAADARKLSDADKALLCDWMNEKLGGYGLMTMCSEAESVMNLPNQAVCVASFFNFDCKVTVEEVENCTLARAPSHACDRNPPACHHLFCQP